MMAFWLVKMSTSTNEESANTKTLIEKEFDEVAQNSVWVFVHLCGFEQMF